METSEVAFSIVRTLVEAGHEAYYAGGWVRDHLMNLASDDIDIATSALPEKVMALFPRTLSVGACFGVVVVIEDNKQFEVATFRQDASYLGGRKPSAVTYTNAKEDAMRRDFTINGMFFNPINERIYDYVDGQRDLKNAVIKAIGDPFERFSEDRLRMIRAVRFSVRFNFQIEEQTKQAIKATAKKLFPAVSMERIWKELCRMVEDGSFSKAVLLLQDLGLLEEIFPTLKKEKEEVKRRLLSVSRFPEECPSILYVMELFEGQSLKQQLEICLYLKVSNKDCRLVKEAFFAKDLCGRESCVEPVQWAHYYANPHSQIFLNILSARLSLEESKKFLFRHRKRRGKLIEAIKRIEEKKPLVSSAHLRSRGVSSGKIMGDLLREAERIAVNQNLESSEEVLDLLEKSLIWSKKDGS